MYNIINTDCCFAFTMFFLFIARLLWEGLAHNPLTSPVGLQMLPQLTVLGRSVTVV